MMRGYSLTSVGLVFRTVFWQHHLPQTVTERKLFLRAPALCWVTEADGFVSPARLQMVGFTGHRQAELP